MNMWLQQRDVEVAPEVRVIWGSVYIGEREMTDCKWLT